MRSATVTLSLIFSFTTSTLAAQEVSVSESCMSISECSATDFLALQNIDCHAYHIFSSRGSDAPIPGHAHELIRLVCNGLKDCSYENVDYPAKSIYAGEGMWCKSAHIGTTNAQQQLTEYAEKCPDSKLIVIGYSQGASVTLDYLGGGGGLGGTGEDNCTQEENPALDRTKAPGKNIVAAAVFGPVVRTAGQPWTVKGGKDYNGTHIRSPEHLAGLKPYASILREYCNNGDSVCAKGSEPGDLKQHLNYFDLYNEEAAEWVVKTAKGQKKQEQEANDEHQQQQEQGNKTATPSATPSGGNGGPGGKANTGGEEAQTTTTGQSETNNTSEATAFTGTIVEKTFYGAVAVIFGALLAFT